MMKNIILFSVLIISGLQLQAQQIPLYSQYMFNRYLINPAVGGSDEQATAMVGYRNQWIGFEDAPKTFYLSFHSALDKKATGKKRFRPKQKNNHGIGTFLFNDRTGPTSRTGGYASYAYHISLNSDIRASLGTFIGVMQYAINTDKIHLADNSNDLDNALSSGNYTQFLPDASVGVYIYSDQFFAGASVFQILQNKFNLNQDILINSKLYNHYLLTGGYNFEVNEEVKIQPSIMIKYVRSAPVLMDFNLKTTLKDLIWLGVSYRNKGTLTGMLGINLNDIAELGYSYDHAFLSLNTYPGSSHEIFLGYNFIKKGKPKYRKRR